LIDAVAGDYPMLSRCLRGFLTPSPGNVLVHSDFSNVEGRGTAWVFGEKWKLEAFRAADNGTGPGIYELSASKILGKLVEEITKAERQAYGKVPELALGFAGGAGAFLKMGKTYGVHMPEEQAEEIKVGWRTAHPMIVRGWYGLNKAAIAAVQSKGAIVQATQTNYQGEVIREIPVKYLVSGSFLWCLLPSGRAICYPYPKLIDGMYGPQLTYMTVPGPTDVRIPDPANGGNWARIATHGGPLTQNVVSGMCRDLLVEVMLALHDGGWPIVLHVHDDCNLDVPFELAEDARRRMDELMNNPPSWAAGFPLAAKAEVLRRYG
jgi:DNA polymerase